jgi:hypothetical protein
MLSSSERPPRLSVSQDEFREDLRYWVDRLVYLVREDRVDFVMCRYHY